MIICAAKPGITGDNSEHKADKNTIIIIGGHNSLFGKSILFPLNFINKTPLKVLVSLSS